MKKRFLSMAVVVLLVNIVPVIAYAVVFHLDAPSKQEVLFKACLNWLIRMIFFVIVIAIPFCIKPLREIVMTSAVMRIILATVLAVVANSGIYVSMLMIALMCVFICIAELIINFLTSRKIAKWKIVLYTIIINIMAAIAMAIIYIW